MPHLCSSMLHALVLSQFKCKRVMEIPDKQSNGKCQRMMFEKWWVVWTLVRGTRTWKEKQESGEKSDWDGNWGVDKVTVMWNRFLWKQNWPECPEQLLQGVLSAAWRLRLVPPQGSRIMEELLTWGFCSCTSQPEGVPVFLFPGCWFSPSKSRVAGWLSSWSRLQYPTSLSAAEPDCLFSLARFSVLLG